MGEFVTIHSLTPISFTISSRANSAAEWFGSTAAAGPASLLPNYRAISGKTSRFPSDEAAVRWSWYWVASSLAGVAADQRQVTQDDQANNTGYHDYDQTLSMACDGSRRAYCG